MHDSSWFPAGLEFNLKPAGNDESCNLIAEDHSCSQTKSNLRHNKFVHLPT